MTSGSWGTCSSAEQVRPKTWKQTNFKMKWRLNSPTTFEDAAKAVNMMILIHAIAVVVVVSSRLKVFDSGCDGLVVDVVGVGKAREPNWRLFKNVGLLQVGAAASDPK